MQSRRWFWGSLHRDIFMAILGASLTALVGAFLAIVVVPANERAAVESRQAALRELIRVELEQNTRTLVRSNNNLQRAVSELERFLSSDSPAPPLAAGYLGIATVGLRTQLEGPSVFHANHRTLALYSVVFGRLVRFMEVQRTVDAAAIQYRAAVTPEDRRRAAAHLIAVITHSLHISDALVGDQGMPVLLQCMDQFSAGEEVCEYTLEGEGPD